MIRCLNSSGEGTVYSCLLYTSSYIKNLFDQFIEGPAIENREIEELGAKYEEFYKAMGGLNDDVAAKRKVEDSVMGVAIEAEMQGFIYGFKVFEVLLNRELHVA